jgi:hypothetical protein
MKQIKLTQGQIAIVDDDKYEYLNQWRWHAQKHGRTYYAVRTQSYYVNDIYTRICIQMHHEVFGRKTYLDHIDGNGYNNQLNNLREAIQLENNRNMRKQENCTSKYKGVSWHKRDSKWSCRIAAGDLLPNGYHKRIWLGYFKNEVEAAKAYDVAAVKYFGSFCKLNFPMDKNE